MTRNRVLVAILVTGALAAPSRASAADYHHVHITAASPLQAVDWYARHMGCEPVTDRSDAANCYGVEVLFVPQTTTGSSQGTGVDHIGFSVADLPAKMAELEAVGVRGSGVRLQRNDDGSTWRDVPGLFKIAFIFDPWGTHIELVEDPETLGFHHVHLSAADPDATLAWYRDVMGGAPASLKGQLDGLRFGDVWFLVSRNAEGMPGSTVEHDWVLGSVASVDVADDDHVWVYHRPLSVEEDQQANAAPPVLEFDRDGTFIQAWGGPGDGYDWPSNEHGIEVDGQGQVWVGGNNGDPSDDMLLKFTHEGEFVMQIGGRARSGGNTDTENLKRPAEASVYPDTNEVFVADGYGNRRVVVFDADSGEFKRMWGAFENEPIEASDEQPPPDEMLGPQQFGTVHGIEVSNDGLVYVADRDLNRIQVFTIDGSYQTQVFVNKDANANSVAGLAFSPDPEQQFIYVADLGNNHIHVLDRKKLEVLDTFGSQGLEPGQFGGVHHIATDSHGNIYTAEAQEGRRAQKLVLKDMTPAN